MLVQADAAQGRLNRRSVRDAARARATAVRDDCDHESVWRRPRVLDLLKFTKNNLDPPVSSKTYSSTESDLTPRPTAVVCMPGDLVDFTAAASMMASSGRTMLSTPASRYRHRRTARYKSRCERTTLPA